MQTTDLQALCAVIEKHCPHIVERRSMKIQDQEVDRIVGFAEHIMRCYENSYRLLGCSEDAVVIQNIERHANTLLTSIEELKAETRLEFSRVDPKAWCEEPELLDRNKLALQELVSTVSKLRRKPHLNQLASKKLNARGIAVTWACRKVWREELNPGGVKCYDDIESGKVLDVKKSQHADRNDTGFGCFLQSIFEVFNIGYKTSSALAALERLGGEEALSLSVEYPGLVVIN